MCHKFEWGIKICTAYNYILRLLVQIGKSFPKRQPFDKETGRNLRTHSRGGIPLPAMDALRWCLIYSCESFSLGAQD